MGSWLRRSIAALLFVSATAHAAPLSPDPTGYWYNPNESGWGVTVAQQNDVLFVILFAYDEQRRPQWLVASDVRDAGGGVFSGKLYRASGPPIGTAFDPRTVQQQEVGTLALKYAVNFGGQASLQLDYTVDGVAVTRGVTRLTWESNATRLPGAYVGGVTYDLAASQLPIGCPEPANPFPPGSEFHVTLSAPDTISIILSAVTVDTLTLIGGTYQQSGQFGVITGGLYQGIVVSPMKVMDVQVSNLVVSADGMMGHVRAVSGACAYEGSVAAIRRSH